jgi:hypothetical protein
MAAAHGPFADDHGTLTEGWMSEPAREQGEAEIWFTLEHRPGPGTIGQRAIRWGTCRVICLT